MPYFGNNRWFTLFILFLLARLLRYNYLNDLPSLDPELYRHLIFLKVIPSLYFQSLVPYTHNMPFCFLSPPKLCKLKQIKNKLKECYTFLFFSNIYTIFLVRVGEFVSPSFRINYSVFLYRYKCDWSIGCVHCKAN